MILVVWKWSVTQPRVPFSREGAVIGPGEREGWFGFSAVTVELEKNGWISAYFWG